MVTFNEHTSRKRNLTSHDQSQFTKLSRQNQPHKAHQTENSRLKESPTQQVVRLLIKYRSNFPSAKHTILVAAFLATKVVVCGRPLWERKGSVREENLTYIAAPVRQA